MSNVTFKKDAEGYLRVGPGRHYRTPELAIKVMYAGEWVTRCNHRVYQMWSSGPCDFKPKYDPDIYGHPTRCKRHSAAGMAEKAAKQEARDQERQAMWDKKISLDNAKQQAIPALRQIAAGHNDPRGLAIQVIAAIDAASGGSNEDDL